MSQYDFVHTISRHISQFDAKTSEIETEKEEKEVERERE